MSTVTTSKERRGFLSRILGRASAGPARARTAAPDGAPAQVVRRDDTAMTTPASFAPAAPQTPFTWPTLLRRVRDVTSADAVLAIDEEGLVVGSSGTLAEPEVDCIAAHVAMAFDLFERLPMLGQKTEAVCAQYVPDGTWLTAIRMRPPHGGRITIALVGPYTLIREDRRKIRDAFARLFDEEPVAQ